MVPIASTPIVQPGLVAPALEQGAAFAIGIGQRLAVVAARHARADPGHFHDRIPQPGAVDLQVRARVSHLLGPNSAIDYR
jgi:hypothetical protein